LHASRFSHTDLGRKGTFPVRFQRIAELADAVIIDEAHHFRNPGPAGETGREESRYRKLFNARFRRALEVRSILQAETAAREMGRLGLLDALDYLALLAAEAPDRYDRAAQRWLSRLLAESPMTPDEAAVAFGCLRGLAAGYGEQSREVLRALVKRRHESLGQ
jgi:hypothetical protein